MLALHRSRIAAVVLAVCAAVACSDSTDPDDDGDGGGGGGGGGGETADVSGLWLWTVNNINSTCGPETGWSAQVEITQSGTSATATSTWRSNGGEHSSTNGTVNGDEFSFDITYPEQTGVLTATHTVTVQPDGDSMTGTEAWSWEDLDSDTACLGGTATVNVTRQ